MVGSIKTEATLKDSSREELNQFIWDHQEGEVSSRSGKPQDASNPSGEKGVGTPKGDRTIEKIKEWFSQHTASEVLNRIGWETNPDKILLLAAFHESNGGSEGWRSSDINERFDQARESRPANFTRDIRKVVSSGLIGAVTPRTYKVGRAGWNKVGEAISALG